MISIKLEVKESLFKVNHPINVSASLLEVDPITNDGEFYRPFFSLLIKSYECKVNTKLIQQTFLLSS